MATAIGTPYSPPSPHDTSSSATMSPIYPDRPIRPLPRRSLRARLSPEVADQIPFPSVPQPSNNVFNHYKDAMAQRNGANVTNAIQEVDKALQVESGSHELERQDNYHFKGNAVDSDDEEQIRIEEQLRKVKSYEEYQAKHGMTPVPTRSTMNGVRRSTEPMSHSVASSNDSVDGYDSFENTNNKKKRKIPTSGSVGSHHASLSTSLSNEMANMGISGSRDVGTSPDGSGDGAGQYYGTGSTAIPATGSRTEWSGAGRGRYGRSARRDTSGRSPLGVSTGNTSNAWQMGRMLNSRRDHLGGTALGKVENTLPDHGIISAAIAEASVLPTTPPKGMEHVSLLEQQSSKKSTPANTQFTFTCESDSSKGVMWPGDSSHPHNAPYYPAPEVAPPSHVPQNQKGFSTQGTQTSPTMAGQPGQNAAPPPVNQQQAQSTPKPRRSAAKRFAMSARDRKIKQQYANYSHPPRDEDIWICEFCEYEDIFGVPPVALIRQYEIKDSKERKRAAEKRRLLEKAKMKGRKGKKGTKNSAKANHAATQQQQNSTQPQHQTQHPDEHAPDPSHSTQDDEYYVDEYDDDPPDPVPSRREVPSRIPRPVPLHRTQAPMAAQNNGT